MKRTLPGFALLLVAATIVGCGALPMLKYVLTGQLEVPPVEPIYCIVQYDQSVEDSDWLVGSDGCGNTWGLRKSDGTCWYSPEPGIVVEIACPTSGDTLSVVVPNAVR